MFYVDNNSGVPNMPPLSPAQSNTPTWFTEGDKNKGVSYIGQDWLNILQAELLNILSEAGIKPDKGKLNQLALSVKAIITANAYTQANNLKEIFDAGTVAQAAARGHLGLGKLATKDSLGPTDVNALAKNQNLKDVPSKAEARKALELGNSATRNVGTTSGTVAAGDDGRIIGAMQKSQNGADIPDKARFINNLGLPELLGKKFDKTGGVVDGEITSTGIVRAKSSSTIELNPNESRPRLTSRAGKDGEWYSSYLQQKTGTIAHLDDIPAATNIVQGTGQSTTSVISQKGVTDALSAHGIGYGQQYMNMTGSRQVGSWYPNNTGRPIFIIVFVVRDYSGGTEESAADINFLVGSEVISIPMIRGANSGGAQREAGSALIPDGAMYTVTTAFGSEVKTWWELR